MFKNFDKIILYWDVLCSLSVWKEWPRSRADWKQIMWKLIWLLGASDWKRHWQRPLWSIGKAKFSLLLYFKILRDNVLSVKSWKWKPLANAVVGSLKLLRYQVSLFRCLARCCIRVSMPLADLLNVTKGGAAIVNKVFFVCRILLYRIVTFIE